MAPYTRVVSAFTEMKKLGFGEDIVKPILKQLLRVYEKNWEPIEDENYRVLVDAILEYQENNAAKRKPLNSNEEEVEHQSNDNSERPLKRTRRPQVGQAASSKSNKDIVASGSALRITESEHSGAPENCSSEHPDKRATSLPTASPRNKPQSVKAGKISGHQSSALTLLAEREKTIESHPVIESGAQMYANAMKAIQANSKSSTNFKEKGKMIVCEALPRKNIPMTKRPSQVVCLKEPKVELGITCYPNCDMPKSLTLIQPKDEPFVDSVQQSNAPCPMAHTNSPLQVESRNGDCSVRNDGDLRTTSSPCLDRRRNDPGLRADSHKRNVSGHPEAVKVSSFDLESASSPLGEVRVSLKCTIPSQSDFSIPSVDAILKLVEEKCVKIYNVKTSFSMKQVIRDVCDSFLELGSNPKESCVPNHRMQSPSRTKDFSNDDCNPVHSKFVPGQSNKTSSFRVLVPEVCKTSPCMTVGNDHERPADNLSDNIYKDFDKGLEFNGHENDSEQNMAVVVADGFMSIYLADLSDGEESVEISLVNEINNVCLAAFKYMPHSIIYENASLDISLARIGDGNFCKACFGDCLTAKTPCVCATKTGSSFAYTVDGLLKEDFLEEYERVYRCNLEYCSLNCPLIRSGCDVLPVPCNGHVAGKFIKECWRKCGCSKICGNRLIQKGITRNLQVFMTSDGKGWGLRSLEDLPKGAFVCEYVGEILTLKELHNRYKDSVDSTAYPVLLDAIWGSQNTPKNERTLCLDGTNYGNVARFINHRCLDSNLIDIPVEVESPDHHYYHIALFTRRKVNALEELTWDYRIDFEKNGNPVKAFECRCESIYCRDVKAVKCSD